MSENTFCFFIGHKCPFNSILDLQNIGWMLADEFRLDVVTTNNDIPDDVRKKFNIVGTRNSASNLGGLKALYSYLSENSPIAVVNMVKPTFPGTVSSVVSQFDTEFIYRYSGDRFYVYKISKSYRKLTAFLLNNIFGRLALTLSDRYIVLGPSGKEQLTKRNVDEKLIYELPPPISEQRLSVGRTKLNIEESENNQVVLFVGRLTRRKGFNFLIEQIPKLIEQRNDLHFVIIGRPIRDVRIESKYCDHITFVGEVDPEKIGDYYNLADILVHPSLTEGLPRVILEALHFGLPVIARDTGEVSSVTSNIFTTATEFREMVLSFEKLSKDDPSSYYKQELESKYKCIFNEIAKNDE